MQSRQEIWTLITAEASALCLDPHLVGAVAMVESSWNPSVVRFEPRWPASELVEPLRMAVGAGVAEEEEAREQATSWGLMQVMGAVARELGYRMPLQRLRDDAAAGVHLGVRKLSQLLVRYHETDAVAAYNAGSPRRTATGIYVNQRYVDDVYAARARLKVEFQAPSP